MSSSHAAHRSGARRLAVLGFLLASAAYLCACEEPPPPRTFIDFLDDPIAREGVLLRCNKDRDATSNDRECADARRAAAAIAARQDEERRKALELQSERKREALRAAVAAEQQRELAAERAAEAAAEAAYEAQWTGEVAPAVDAPQETLPQPSPAPSAGAALDFVTVPTTEKLSPPATQGEVATLQPPVAAEAEIPRPFRSTESPP